MQEELAAARAELRVVRKQLETEIAARVEGFRQRDQIIAELRALASGFVDTGL